jgi:hypothetical protein
VLGQPAAEGLLYEHLRARREHVRVAGEEQGAQSAPELGQVRALAGRGQQDLHDHLANVVCVARALGLARGGVDPERESVVVPLRGHGQRPAARDWVEEMVTLPCVPWSAARHHPMLASVSDGSPCDK